MAIDSDSGLLQWVVDGVVVENATVDILRDTNANKPADLSGKIVLGAYQSSSHKKWNDYWISGQVSNLNIFSTALAIGDMVENTQGVRCSSKGDYLAWQDMQWTHNDKTHIEYVSEEEVCKRHPSLNLYPAVFPTIDSCSNLCQKLLNRIPPSVTLQQWDHLQEIIGGLKKPGNVWLAMDDSSN